MEYLRKIKAKEPFEINGEIVLLDEEICLEMIYNIESIYQVGTQNINILKKRDAFN